ncbi:MAG TPA: transglycosylase domain-containing protein [Candidatus Limnocylindrales bacterium]|nr:transglycosylase domain-containing protein [Candidatus Limnocylindrales bacterium]
MQTSLTRRQRRRRLNERRRPRGSGAAKYVAVAIPLIIFTLIALAGVAGATTVVAGYSFLSKDLPDPQKALEAIEYDQQTAVYDRTGKVLLARLGSDRRELVTFDQIPPALVDATTAIEDKTFWENSGFDPLAFVAAAVDTLQGNDRGGSTITQQLVRNRLLPAEDIEPGSDRYQRKLREIIQSIRLTEAYPGEDGKKLIMESYLNNNYYGNRSYGVAAAAASYWKKDLKDLTLAQYALLAGIPKSPSNYDLVQNAVGEEFKDDKGAVQTRLVVPQDAQVVRRRNQVLELMKERTPLTGETFTDADFEAAKVEPVILAEQGDDKWRAPQFVWQAREELAEIICGEAQCEEIDTGGFTVITSLDYRMQRIVEKWVYAAAIIPNGSNVDKQLKNRAIPRSEWAWIKDLRGHNIHNAASGVIDYRTGEILAYAGSASYTAKGTKKMQPQFDVLGDGWRQPGSAIKPLIYLVGIDDKTMTASTMFMDVVTNFGGGGTPFYPTQADRLERGPVRLRNALQFSLNIPAIKAGFINGLEHQFERTKDFGLVYPSTENPVPSMSIGTLVVHPIDLIAAYGMIGNNGLLMPHHTVVKVLNDAGEQVWPPVGYKEAGTRAVARQAAYIITDILAGNTIKSVNPFWGKWQVTDGLGSGRVRPAAYKTGTTNDNKDVHAYGYLAAPSDKTQPALVAGVWMGNSDNTPNDGKLSLDTSAPLWSAILSEVSKDLPIEGFARTRPKGLVTATVDAFTGMKPNGGSRRTVEELFMPGTAPSQGASYSKAVDVDQASGLLWQEGCVGPMVTKSFIDYSKAESGFKVWQKADAGWQARAARGPGVSGGPKRTRTAYFYGGGFYPLGRSWGGAFAPTKKCPIGPPPPTECVSTDPLLPCPSLPPEAGPSEAPANGKPSKP